MHFYRGSGVAAARYFDEGHQGAEAYYSERGRVAVAIDTWTAGERTATTVLAEPGDLIRWVEGVDLDTGEAKGRIRAGGTDRLPLRFVEVAVNNPKSLSIVASQNPAVAAAVDRLLGRQADEIARYLSAVAVTRVGPRGGQVEVGGLTVETARVAHLTSREGDPHRHVHLMVNTRVKSADGVWHGMHSAAIRQHIGAVQERGMRVLVSDAGFRRVLAGEGYTLGSDGEIDQARRAVALLSKRSVLVAANRARMEAAWRTAHPGREPSQRVRNGWDQQAWADGRKAKPTERASAEQLAERVRAELAEAGFDFTPGARPPVRLETGISVGGIDREAMAEEAVAVLSSQKSAWSSADLTAKVDAAVTLSGVIGDPQAVAELVEDVRARAAGQCQSVLDPGLYAPTAMSRHLTSEQVVAADLRLNLGLAGLAGGADGRDPDGRALAAAQGLDGGQAAALAAVCGTRRLEVVIGPAGTGKTRMLAVAKQQLDLQGRELVVIAPTRKAALLAGGEVGVEGSSLSKLVYEYGFRWDQAGRWSRLEVGQQDRASGRVYGGPGPAATLSGRSVIVIDEAGLMTVDQANAVVDVAAQTGAAIRLVGDPRQLGAVGRGGVMETAGRWAYEGPVMLDQIHRFLTVGLDETGLPVTETDSDYAALSLLLRDGRDPELAAEALVQREAVAIHPSQAQAVEAIAAEVAAQGGEGESLAVTVATNDDADQINRAVRDLRVQAGTVDDIAVVAGTNGIRIGAGDRIMTRRNNPAADVANRETWTVEAITTDGAVLARHRDRHVHLEAGYVAEAVQLAYATTDYGNQGVTVDRSLTWVTGATTAGGLYVGVTRGRYHNMLHVIAEDTEDARQQIIRAAERDRADRGLDVARTLAQADASAVPTAPARPAPPRAADPADWHTVAEIDAAARRVEARLAAGLRTLQEVAVIPGEQRERDNRADRDAAAEARRRAVQHRDQAERLVAERDQLVNTAIADYVAARDDARTIAAGPGLFGRKVLQVEAAKGRREETARRWSDPQLPGAAWTDQAVRGAASTAADRIVAPAIGHHRAEADREEHMATNLDRRIASRNHHQQTAIETNQRYASRRDAFIAGIETERVAIRQHRQVRAQRVATMTSDQVALADQARTAYLAEQTRQARLAAQREQTLTAHEQARISPPVEHGPSIGL